jgi:hypothetical protein
MKSYGSGIELVSRSHKYGNEISSSIKGYTNVDYRNNITLSRRNLTRGGCWLNSLTVFTLPEREATI